jgi:hypothetical protein
MLFALYLAGYEGYTVRYIVHSTYHTVYLKSCCTVCYGISLHYYTGNTVDPKQLSIVDVSTMI